MAKKSKIKPTDIEYKSHIVKPTEVDPSVFVSINFKHLVEKEKKYKYKKQSGRYFVKLLERLSGVCGMNKNEMTVINKKALRCHGIDFTETRVSESGFCLGEDINDDAWQFQISSNEHGRVHGYFIVNIFYVVWLDPMHELYPDSND